MLRRHFMINTKSSIPNNEIWYTSSDGSIITPYSASSLPTILSNTYNNKGVIKCTSDITTLNNTFYTIRTLTSITIPNSVTSIGEHAFNDCRGLTSINIPNNVTSIKYCAFYECRGLTSITIGKGLTSIANNAFYNCNKLTNISYEGTIAQWNAITKGGDNWNAKVPATVVHCTDGDVEI